MGDRCWVSLKVFKDTISESDLEKLRDEFEDLLDETDEFIELYDGEMNNGYSSQLGALAKSGARFAGTHGPSWGAYDACLFFSEDGEVAYWAACMNADELVIDARSTKAASQFNKARQFLRKWDAVFDEKKPAPEPAGDSPHLWLKKKCGGHRSQQTMWALLIQAIATSNTVLDEDAVCEYLGCSRSTLAQMIAEALFDASRVDTDEEQCGEEIFEFAVLLDDQTWSTHEDRLPTGLTDEEAVQLATDEWAHTWPNVVGLMVVSRRPDE